MMMVYDRLNLCCLTHEQHSRTCGYWFTITAQGFTPHTAFRTRPALLKWMDDRGLRLTAPLPGEYGEHQVQRIEGEYAIRSHNSVDEMPHRGKRALYLQNAEYTAAVITSENGRAVVNFVNVNSARPAFDYQAAREHEDAGREGLPRAMLTARPFHLGPDCGIAALPGDG